MPLTAQNGLEYTIDLLFTMQMMSNHFKKLQHLIGNLVNYTYKIGDEGIIVIYKLNIDEEIMKMGRFKDVPTITEINRYLPLVYSSDTYMKSDIVFSKNVIFYYMDKESFSKGRVAEELKEIYKLLESAINNPTVKISNLIYSKKRKI